MRLPFLRVVVIAAVVASLSGASLTAQSSTLASKGMASNPPNGTILAEITDISAGPHTFRAIVSATVGAALLIEWRDAANAKTKWSQLIAVPNAATVTVAIEEPHDFEDGDRLRIGVLVTAIGFVQGSLSLK